MSHTIKAGSIVRLPNGKRTALVEGMFITHPDETNETASGCRLNKRLQGLKYWNACDLVEVLTKKAQTK